FVVDSFLEGVLEGSEAPVGVAGPGQGSRTEVEEPRSQVEEVVDAVRRTGHAATVTIKADTGLNRNGVGASDYPSVLAALLRAQADAAVRVHGIMSHLVHGDDPDHPLNDLQAQRLTDMVATAGDRGLRFEVVHLSNSPAVLTRPDLAFDMVRPGIAVYGQSPLPERGDLGLQPAMTVTCPVVLIRSLKAGDGVSYGHTWVAERDTTVALIPVGYADGVFRSLSGRIEVSINGRRYPGVGRVCMDQFVVDLGPGPTGVAAGDEAILFGPGTAGEPTAQDWAELLGTINYEIVTSPRGRIVRSFRGGHEQGGGESR
ncbi:MAG: alanine racemase, partial [Mycobacterium sp.]